MSCFSGCLMSSAGIQKLFCGIYSALKCSLDEFVGEKVVSPSYSSTILGPTLRLLFWKLLKYQPHSESRHKYFWIKFRLFPGTSYLFIPLYFSPKMILILYQLGCMFIEGRGFLHCFNVLSSVHEYSVAQSCPTFCDSMDWSLPGSTVHRILQAYTRVACHTLLQGIFLTQGLNWYHLHWQVDSLSLHHLRSPYLLYRYIKQSLTYGNCFTNIFWVN